MRNYSDGELDEEIAQFGKVKLLLHMTRASVWQEVYQAVNEDPDAFMEALSQLGQALEMLETEFFEGYKALEVAYYGKEKGV